MMLINREHVKVSRRDGFLMLFGVTYGLIGYSLLNIPTASKPLLHAALRFALDVFPIEVYGWAWIVTGVLAIFSGAVYRWDWIGFGVSVFMPLVWSLAYFIAQIQDNVPRAWVSGTIFALLGIAVAIVAGMPDPRDRLDGPRPHHRHWWRR